jgi:methylated-DNA-protein-cysteine methyltransferase-like protein
MPCHRVVFADGGICPGYAFGGPDVQRKLLEEEGIAFVDETHVDLDAFKWDPAMNAAATDSDEDDGLEQRPTDVDWEAEIGRW